MVSTEFITGSLPGTMKRRNKSGRRRRRQVETRGGREERKEGGSNGGKSVAKFFLGVRQKKEERGIETRKLQYKFASGPGVVRNNKGEENEPGAPTRNG